VNAGQGCRRTRKPLAIVIAALSVCAYVAVPAMSQTVAPPTGAAATAAPSVSLPGAAPSYALGAGKTVEELPQRLSTSFGGVPPLGQMPPAPPKVDDPTLLPAPQFGPNAYRYDDYQDWTAQLLPTGLIYRSYLAGVKEPRLGFTFDNIENFGWVWDITLGGRVGLFRYGPEDPVRPQGFEIDVEGAGMPRLNMEHDQDLIAADFRAGLPITYGIGNWQTKFAYYHLSSHLGDEYMIQNPTFRRVNYSRDCLVLGESYYVTPNLRVYAEAGWAFYSDVGEPWEFQGGVEYSPLVFNGLRGSPFAAFNAQSRQEQNFSGNIVAQAGWQWRGKGRGQLFRVGVQYYNGESNQFQLYDQFENKFGLGMWYDY
jgi:hypothetical protein